jgi:hypothetical protein
VLFFAAGWIEQEIWNGPALAELRKRNGPRGQSMGQQIQKWRSFSSQRSWLSKLIGTMELIARPELRAVPCDERLLATVRAQLARPASGRIPYTSPYSRRN